MSRIKITKTVQAPVEDVFNTISDIGKFSEAVPDIINIEILSNITSGVGTRFRETRLMNGKEATTELEVTEYVENKFIRLVADSHGTVWDSLFTVKEKESEGKTELVLVMEANAYKLMPKLINLLMKKVMKRALEKDIEAVKQFCEK